MGEWPPRLERSSARQLIDYLRHPYALFWEGYKRHGPVFRVKLAGQPEWVVVGEPALIRAIFRESADTLYGDSDALKAFLGEHAILFQNGERHRRARRVLSPPFKHARMALYAESMVRHLDAALDRLEPGTRFRAMDLMIEVTLGTIIESVFGVRDPGRHRRLVRLYAEWMRITRHPIAFSLSMAIGGERMREVYARMARRSRATIAHPEAPLSRIPLLRIADILREIRLLVLDEIACARAEAARADASRNARPVRDDILFEMLQDQSRRGEESSDEELFDQLNTLLVGGHETTSIAASFTIFDLFSSPEWLDDVQEEIRALIGESLRPSFETALRAKLLGAAIDESLRLHPIAVSMPRVVARELEIEGRIFPAGTRLFPAPAISHFRADLFPDPHRYDPSRFLDKKVSPFAYFPFGGGSRACIGKPFAALQLRLLMMRLLQRAELRLDGATAREKGQGILVAPADGVPLRLLALRWRAVPN